MFEKTLSEKLKRVFQLKKVSFDAPGESAEQDMLFIEIDTARNSIKDGRAIARVTGRIRVFSTVERMPFGFFSKAIAEMSSDDAMSFFFFDFEENSGRFLNLVERTASFVFFFSAQYDPDKGILNETNFLEAD